MNLTHHLEIKKYESKLLALSITAALIIEFLILTGMGIYQHWLAHPQAKTEWASPQYIETEIYEQPKPEHLFEEKKSQTLAKPEKALSVHPDEGKKSKDNNPTKDENQTQAGPQLAPNHGPIAIETPAPVIPDYLKDHDMATSIVIDFFVTSMGIVTPHLVSSSGNEELDAIALATAKKWRFKPAEREHRAYDSKVRLRINFQVQ